AAVVARSAIVAADARMAAARRSFELVSRQYSEGMATQVEYLDARSTMTRAQLNAVLTHHQFAARCVELERAAALRDLDRDLTLGRKS
ncbi:MAG: TolC family protein, partial [Longimicrobiales bacterium]